MSSFNDEKMVMEERLVRLKDDIDYGRKPYCSLGALMATASNNKNIVGTGILISPNLVLTAAHNIYDWNNNEEYSNIRFLPAANGKYSIEDFKVVKAWKVHRC